MRVMMVGDTHGNLGYWSYLINKALYNNVEMIVQLGDFGYWEHKQHGVEYLFALEHILAEADLPVVWVDGNHENHVVLRANYGPGGGRYNPTEEGFWTIRPHIFHAPRGCSWEWDGVKFLAVGGAFSIDREWRRIGTSFWFEEVLTDNEAEEAAKVGKVDVIVSHDVPQGVGVMQLINQVRGTNYQMIRESEYNRKLLRDVVNATEPNYLFHGHYHFRYTEDLKLDSKHTVRINGLNCDESNEESYLIVDLKADPKTKGVTIQ